MKLSASLLVALFAFFYSANAQTKTSFFSKDTLPSKTHGIVAYPMITFQPETHLAFGISIVQYFRIQKRDSLFRPSVLHPFAAVTMNKQAYIECPFQLFLDQEKYYFYGIVAFFKYPYKFYGIGNNMPKDYFEIFDANIGTYTLSAVKKINSKIYVGLRSQGNYSTVTSIEQNKLLDTSDIAGKTGCYSTGVGPMFLYDTRDNIFSTHKGSFIEVSSLFNAKGFLSDFSFASYMLDARTFIPLHKTHILALQAYALVNAGSVPFIQMGLLGGPKRMRGYYEGRYRDNNYYAFQAEYRSPFIIHDRIGFAAFGGFGMVNAEAADINLKYLHPTYGGGVRFRFNRKERLTIRLDMAFGDGNNRGFYATLNEAF